MQVDIRMGFNYDTLISYNDNYDYFAGPECEFSSKNSSLKCWLCFRLFLWRTQKYFSDMIFVAPLIFSKEKKENTAYKENMYEN